MSHIIIGMDGGGTKTNICMQNTNTSNILQLTGRELNINGNSNHCIEEHLSEIQKQIESQGITFRQVSSICIGIAGYSNPDTQSLFRNFFREQNYTGILTLTGDCQTAHSGALAGDCGAIIISGTGSICYGTSQDGMAFQCGGNGYLLDDGGSGYQIGLSILKYAAQAMDGRISENIFSRLLADKYGIATREQLIYNVYSAPALKKNVASFAPLLIEAENIGSPLADTIIKEASAQLFAITSPVIKKAHLENGKLALCGSIFQYYHSIKKAFCSSLKRLFPDLDVFYPLHDAAYGALLIAQKSLSSTNAGKDIDLWKN